MKLSRFLVYASLVFAVAGGAIWYIINDYYAQESPNNNRTDIVMYKNAGCECCDKWASHMQGAGYSVSIVETGQLGAIKADHNIPRTMGACHTAIAGDYVIEGHVPAQDVMRLLRERPDNAAGLVVPGMPASSPGMNTALNEPYKVYLLDKEGNTEVFTQH